MRRPRGPSSDHPRRRVLALDAQHDADVALDLHGAALAAGGDHRRACDRVPLDVARLRHEVHVPRPPLVAGADVEREPAAADLDAPGGAAAGHGDLARGAAVDALDADRAVPEHVERVARRLVPAGDPAVERHDGEVEAGVEAEVDRARRLVDEVAAGHAAVEQRERAAGVDHPRPRVGVLDRPVQQHRLVPLEVRAELDARGALDLQRRAGADGQADAVEEDARGERRLRAEVRHEAAGVAEPAVGDPGEDADLGRRGGREDERGGAVPARHARPARAADEGLGAEQRRAARRGGAAGAGVGQAEAAQVDLADVRVRDLDLHAVGAHAGGVDPHGDVAGEAARALPRPVLEHLGQRKRRGEHRVAAPGPVATEPQLGVAARAEAEQRLARRAGRRSGTRAPLPVRRPEARPRARRAGGPGRRPRCRCGRRSGRLRRRLPARSGRGASRGRRGA